MSNFIRQTFKDSDTGMIIGQADTPDNYRLNGRIVNQWQQEMVPFTCSVQASDPESKIILYSSGRQMYEDYTNPMARSILQRDPNQIKSGFRDFIEPQEFLTQFASGLVNSPVTPLAVTKLPSFYGNHLQEYSNQFRDYFMNHKIDIGVRIEMTSCYTDAILMRFSATVDGNPVVVLAGCDYRGIEMYDANSMGNMMGGLGNLFGGGLFGNRTQTLSQNRTGFGHGKENGQRVDVIQWGAERMYACIYMPEKETEAVQAFITFVQSYTPDENLMRQFYTLVEQRFQSNYMRSMQLNGMARQMQMQAMQFQQQTARNISQQMSGISDGIMDSWNQKMASQSRMSQNYSEAIRGVNTYMDTNGKTFEFSNQADHVYTNQYGDHIGVSGSAVDQETANHLNWTEVFRK